MQFKLHLTVIKHGKSDRSIKVSVSCTSLWLISIQVYNSHKVATNLPKEASMNSKKDNLDSVNYQFQEVVLDHLEEEQAIVSSTKEEMYCKVICLI